MAAAAALNLDSTSFSTLMLSVPHTISSSSQEISMSKEVYMSSFGSAPSSTSNSTPSNPQFPCQCSLNLLVNCGGSITQDQYLMIAAVDANGKATLRLPQKFKNEYKGSNAWAWTKVQATTVLLHLAEEKKTYQQPAPQANSYQQPAPQVNSYQQPMPFSSSHQPNMFLTQAAYNFPLQPLVPVSMGVNTQGADPGPASLLQQRMPPA
jgi:hypothetical protein